MRVNRWLSWQCRGVGLGYPASLLLLALVACDSTDIGRPCPELLGDTPPGTTTQDGETVTQEVVAQNARFPCDDLVCIASQGISGYCTKKCRADGSCPPGFDCRVIQALGEDFGGERFCAWKPCRERSDCGKADDFCCAAVAHADPLQAVKLCQYSDEGTCG